MNTTKGGAVPVEVIVHLVPRRPNEALVIELRKLLKEAEVDCDLVGIAWAGFYRGGQVGGNVVGEARRTPGLGLMVAHYLGRKLESLLSPPRC